MGKNLYEEYNSLPIPSATHEYSFSAKVIKGFPNHRIAKNRKDNPSLLIKVKVDDYYKKNYRLISFRKFPTHLISLNIMAIKSDIALKPKRLYHHRKSCTK